MVDLKRLTDTAAFPIVTTVDATVDKIGLIDVSDTTQNANGSTKVATPNQIAAAIKLDDLGAPDDNTDLNASTSRHGLLPKLNNVATDFLNGQGGWTTPAGGSSLPVNDTTSLVQDPSDTTKEMRIDVGAVATGTVRVLTMPNQDVDLTPNSGTFAGALPTSDATALVMGSSDTTKRLRFEVDGFTTATTRVLTPPNFDGTIATLAGTETFTNKTLTTPTIGDLTNATHDHTTAATGGALVNFNIGALRIVDIGLNTPPGSPAAYDLHIMGTSPTGGWSGFTAGGLALRNAGNSAWINLGAPKDGYQGRVLTTGTHHYAGALVAYDSALASEFSANEGWHPIGPLYISTAHPTGSRSRVNNRPIWSLTVTTTGADHTASGTVVNVAHGQTFDWTDAAIWVEGNIRNTGNNQARKIPQNFASTVFETNANNTNIQFAYASQNLSSYTFVGTLYFTK